MVPCINIVCVEVGVNLSRTLIFEEVIVQDEYGTLRPDEIEHREDSTMLCSGSTLREDVNAALGLNLISEDVASIGGFLTELAGAVSADNASFNLEPWRFVVQDSDAKHVCLVHIEPLQHTPEPPVA